MCQQLTFADSEFSSKRRQTRKEIFLSRMDNLLPWTQLLEVIEPFYPKVGNGRALKKHPRKNKTAINIEHLKVSIRAKVEHPFRIIKCQFGFIKARYKGLTKNDSQLAMLFTLASLFKVDQMLRRQPRSV
ncbi:transposase [Vibrio cholerae]